LKKRELRKKVLAELIAAELKGEKFPAVENFELVYQLGSRQPVGVVHKGIYYDRRKDNYN